MPRRAAADFRFPASTSERLRPPDELKPGSPEREVFLDTVTACSPDHFRPAEIHLLVTFCEAVVRKRVATGELAASGVVVDGKLSAWTTELKNAIRDITVTSRLLRLTPLARHSTPIKQPDAPPNIYDRMALEHADDEPGAH